MALHRRVHNWKRLNACEFTIYRQREGSQFILSFGWIDPLSFLLAIWCISQFVCLVRIRCYFYLRCCIVSYTQMMRGLLGPQINPRLRLKLFNNTQSVPTISPNTLHCRSGITSGTMSKKKKKITIVTIILVWWVSSMYEVTSHIVSWHTYSSVLFFSTYKKKTNRCEEALSSVYSIETMHAIGGGLGYLWM